MLLCRVVEPHIAVQMNRLSVMACPRIFVSSTYYDLRHVREIIRDFVINLGYEPILSEYSDVFYNPSDTVQNSCLKEISSCDMFVLIVGKRYGSLFPGDSLSITHREYLEAQNQSIPIYSFIDLDVLHDFEFHEKNPGSTDQNYRVVESENIFDLIRDIQSASTNNLLLPYTSISDLLQHLKKQWANLFSSYLQKDLHEKEQSKPSKVVLEDHPDIEKYRETLETFNMSNVTQDQINEAGSFADLVETMGGSAVDLGTDIRVELDGVITNVGKVVVRILEENLHAIKTQRG